MAATLGISAEPTPEMIFGFPGTREGVITSEDRVRDPYSVVDPEDLDLLPIRLGFSGREFLTWLVWYAEVADGRFGDFTLTFGDRLTLSSATALMGQMKASGETPADAADLRYAIAGGLTVREAKIIAIKGAREFVFTLSADSLDVRGAKLPSELAKGAKEAKDDRLAEESVREGLLFDRCALLEELDGMIIGALGRFLGMRLSATWSRDIVPGMRTWLIEALSGGGEAADGENEEAA